MTPPTTRLDTGATTPQPAAVPLPADLPPASAPLSTSPLSSALLAPHFAALGEPYVRAVPATQVPAPRLLHFNEALAAALDLPQRWQAQPQATQILCGNAAWPGYASMASVYGGHQFGVWVRQLGDGRALLIAELDTPRFGRAELQLKGAGPTPYARGADGRAVLRSSIREYLCSEAMHALGVPTTRCLSLVGSPLPVQRETVESAAVVCRVSPSFVRFGHFEFYARNGMAGHLPRLADHVIDLHFGHLRGQPRRHAAWLGEVVERTAALMARWQTLGFCHGVMNTDNFSILGLTIDYGPFGFMDRFRAHHVCNHSDHEGRYAWQAQPMIGQWNCARLLQACMPLLSDDDQEAAAQANDLYARYAEAYNTAVMRHWCAKLGLVETHAEDATLLNRWLTLLQHSRSDFTLSFRQLADIPGTGAVPPDADRQPFAGHADFAAWLADWRARLHREGSHDDHARAARMARVNPLYVLRNHLAQRAIEAAQQGDTTELDTLARVLQRPFDAQPGRARYAQPPGADAPEIEVSCSS